MDNPLHYAQYTHLCSSVDTQPHPIPNSLFNHHLFLVIILVSKLFRSGTVLFYSFVQHPVKQTPVSVSKYDHNINNEKTLPRINTGKEKLSIFCKSAKFECFNIFAWKQKQSEWRFLATIALTWKLFFSDICICLKNKNFGLNPIAIQVQSMEA